MKNNLISIIMPVYNCGNYISDAIESALAQTYKNIELIIINDGSTDNTAMVLKKFPRVRCYALDHGGQSYARNYGIESSKGDYLSFLDADDLWTGNKLELQINCFENNPGLDMTLGHVKEFISPEIEPSIQMKFKSPNEYIPGIIPGTLLIKRESFYKVGLFDTAWKLGEFIDWYSRAKQIELKSIILPDILMKRRIHLNNTGLNNKSHISDYIHIIKKMIDRKKKA